MTCCLMLDLSEAENAEVLRLAIEAGLSTHEFVRRRILGLPLTPVPVTLPARPGVATPAAPMMETKADAVE